MKIFGILFVTVFIHITTCAPISSEENDDDGDNWRNCLKEYLEQRENLRNGNPTKKLWLTCRFTLSIVIKNLKLRIHEDIEKMAPTNNATCLIDEFDKQQAVDILLKISMIEDSETEETNKKAQMEVARKELLQPLIRISEKCNADLLRFLQIFHSYFGLKDVTPSTLQRNYCFAKFAHKNNLLPLDGIDLNPFNITTSTLNCDDIVESEREHEEKLLLKKAIRNVGPKIARCVLDFYIKEGYFNAYIIGSVTEYLDLPKDVDDIAQEKLGLVLFNFTTLSYMCASTVPSE